jgi:hypothetical protein
VRAATSAIAAHHAARSQAASHAGLHAAGLAQGHHEAMQAQHAHQAAINISPHALAHMNSPHNVLAKAAQAEIAQAMQQQQNYAAAQPQPGQTMMWNGQQWVPAPQQPGQMVQPQPYSQYGQQPNDAGNNSIASNGGGNGLLGFLMGL